MGKINFSLAQTQQTGLINNDFQKTFQSQFKEAEIAPEDQQTERIFLMAAPFRMPSWILNFSNSGDSINYMIGVSDPGMDTADAYNQAELRAIIMHGILKKAQVKNLTDFYTNEVENLDKTLYEYFSRADGELVVPKYEIVEQTYSTFGEGMVILRVFNDPSAQSRWGSSLEIKTDLYKSEYTYMGKTELTAHYQLTVCKAPGDTLIKYIVTEIDKEFETYSFFDGKEIVSPSYPFLYVTGRKADQNESKSYMAGGFWKEFYKTVLTQLMTLSQTNTSKLEKMSERFEPSFEKQTRNVSNNKYSFQLQGFTFNDTFLTLTMTGNIIR